MPRFAGLAPFCLLLLGATDVCAQSSLLARFDRPAWTAPQSFTSIVAVRELVDGRVLLTDVDEHLVYLVSSDGQSITTVGRSGSGPGEYTAPTVLLSMPGDSTLLLDRDARRFLMLDPNGRVAATTPFPPSLTAAAPHLRGADPKGRLFFQASAMSEASNGVVPLIRWDRRTGHIDTIATVHLPSPRFTKLPGGATVRQITPYTPSDDWGVTPTGRVNIVRGESYRLEWVASDGSLARGPILPAVRVRVTEADKRANEPKGPPFRHEYPTTKPVFAAGYSVLDAEGRTVVRKSQMGGAQTVQWDVLDSSGKLLGTQEIPSNLRVLAVTRRIVYVVRIDSDDLEWLEAYAR